jgi:hypothetical protein
MDEIMGRKRYPYPEPTIEGRELRHLDGPGSRGAYGPGALPGETQREFDRRSNDAPPAQAPESTPAASTQPGSR